jgi:hypothetical protein
MMLLERCMPAMAESEKGAAGHEVIARSPCCRALGEVRLEKAIEPWLHK